MSASSLSCTFVPGPYDVVRSETPEQYASARRLRIRDFVGGRGEVPIYQSAGHAWVTAYAEASSNGSLSTVLNAQQLSLSTFVCCAAESPI